MKQRVRPLTHEWEHAAPATPPPASVNPQGRAILGHLDVVAAERRARVADAALAGRVREVKRFQHVRFEQTYADLLAQPRYAKAARFFLEELYGPADFTARDNQFARVVPALVRLFPHEIVCTVASLADLHALSVLADRTATAFKSRCVYVDFAREVERGWTFVDAGPGSCASTDHEGVFKAVASRLIEKKFAFRNDSVGGVF